MRQSRARPTTVILVVLLLGCTTSVPPSPSFPPASASPSLAPSAETTATPTQPSPMPTVAPTPTAPAVPAWRPAGDMTTPRSFPTATLLPDGTVLVTGGTIDGGTDGRVPASAELFDPERTTWTVTGEMSTARWSHTATLLLDGRVLVAGSSLDGIDRLASAELYDPTDGGWIRAGRMHHGRGDHTATLLPDGTVLVVGGGAEDDEFEGGPRSATAELYDPVAGTWTITGSLIEARNGFTATLLPDGRVLVAGGDADYRAAEVYDPRLGRWTATGHMIEGRFGHTATLLPDGTVLVTGGCACSEMPPALASAELYDPTHGTWTATGSMRQGRFGHTATLLADGTVLVVDGLTDEAGSAELYEPITGRWTPTASPGPARFGHAATLLVGGSVLVTGGEAAGGAASAELYDPNGGS
jgi:Galactose oxidase, central domain